LLMLARSGKDESPQAVIPKIPQETLAEMIRATRSRVNFFMNKFRKLGFIKYNGGLQINNSLLSVVFHERCKPGWFDRRSAAQKTGVMSRTRFGVPER